MEMLTLPSKRPLYRQDRSHKDFLCTLKNHKPTYQDLISELKAALVKRFYIVPFDYEGREMKSHRQATLLVDMGQ
jgi:hypothetical protein